MSVYPFIEAEKAEPEGNVAKACHLLEVSRSAYYEWSNGTPSGRALSDAELADKVVDIFTKSRRTYGAPRITTKLAEGGIRVAKKRVARLMVLRGLAGRAKRRFKKTTIADPNAEAAAVDLIKRAFGPETRELDSAWCGDITYVRTWEGWLYLATVIDLSSRRVVGFAMAEHMRAELVCDALEMAIEQRRPVPGLIFHSDRGSQGEFKWSSQQTSSRRWRMGRRPGWMVTLTGRPAMRSPGRPPIQRDVERVFWLKIAEGLSSEEAALACGVSGPVGSRWFRERGGMPSMQLTSLSGRYLSFAEREEIALHKAQGLGVRAMATAIGRSPSTISRELRRNAATRGGTLEYRASIAQWKAELQTRRPKIAKLAVNDQLRDYVQDRLAGTVARPNGEQVVGPLVRFVGRRHGRRADRRWAKSWSPEQISHRLRVDFPHDESMRISHEAIYQALYIQSRGALKRELVACLRTGRALRVPRARTRGRGKKFVTAEIMISQRPAEANDRAVPGHWEGDLIMGLNRSAIGTLVERTTRFTMLLRLPPMEGHGVEPRVKNGPPLAGHGAEAVRDAIADTIMTLPAQLRRSLTWDQGAEMAQHAQLRVDTGLAIYFCDPQSPWQRGTNENTNGLLRQYFPKGTDLSRHSRDDLDAVALALNTRPRKTLGWKTPAEQLNDHLLSVQQDGVATTP